MRLFDRSFTRAGLVVCLALGAIAAQPKDELRDAAPAVLPKLPTPVDPAAPEPDAASIRELPAPILQPTGEVGRVVRPLIASPER